MRSSSSIAVIVFSAVATVLACGDHEDIGRRNPGGRVISGLDHWNSRKRDGSDTSCNGYYYPPATALVPSYPSTWTTAQLLPNDTAARALFDTLNAQVQAALPNDQPRGQPNGDHTGVNYDGGADPDCWWTWTQCTSPKASTGLEADITTVPEPGSWGLTYDDGPNCGNAPLYGYMQQNNLRASLFYIGSNVMNWPLQGLAGVNGSHQICVHTWSHQYMTALTNEQVFAELYYTRQIIKDLLGVTPLCWRPPFGDVDNRVRMFAKGLNLQTIVWSEDTADWTLGTGASVATVDGNYDAIINKQKSGQYSTFGPIVLSHELSTATINEALKYLPIMQSTFSHLVPIAAAYNQTHPYAESNIYYPTFAEYVAGNEQVTTGSAAPTSSIVTTSATSASSASSTTSASAAAVTSSAGSGNGTDLNGSNAVAHATSSAGKMSVSGALVSVVALALVASLAS